MTVTFFFYNLFPTVNIYAFEKYYLTVCLYLKVSHSKSYKTIQHCLFPCLEGKITSLTRVIQKQHGLLFLLSEGSLPFPHLFHYTCGSTCENAITLISVCFQEMPSKLNFLLQYWQPEVQMSSPLMITSNSSTPCINDSKTAGFTVSWHITCL